VKWNFQKFLVNRKGKVVARFEPKFDPLEKKCTDAIEKALKEPAGKAKTGNSGAEKKGKKDKKGK
jgi:hypothetical protein